MEDAERNHVSSNDQGSPWEDYYRPTYHFTIDGEGLPGDPNGCFYAQGRHHLMYLYKCENGMFRWGHVSSTDLLHWDVQPDALLEAQGDEGCFSGGAFVDEDGTAYLSFWIYHQGEREEAAAGAGIGIAWSKPPYERWQRFDAVAISSVRWGVAMADGKPVGCADPSNIWKKGDTYYMQTGNLLVLDRYGRAEDSPVAMRGDWAELFSSKDLHKWHYEGRFYQRNERNTWTEENEDCMCPGFFPLPKNKDGGEPTDEWLELFISHNRGCQYYIGSYEGNTFTPHQHGRMTWVDSAFFAPEAYLDGAGRLLMFAWLRDDLPQAYQRFGWSGVYGVPRLLWVQDKALCIAPAPEISALRYDEIDFGPAAIDEEYWLGQGRQMMIVFSAQGQGMGLCLSIANQKISIFYREDGNELVMDASQSGSEGICFVEKAPLVLKREEALSLTILVDNSVVEVFANDRQAITRRVYIPSAEPYQAAIIGQGRVLGGSFAKLYSVAIGKEEQ